MPMKRIPLADLVRVEDRGFVTPCWVWKGRLNQNGYGKRWSVVTAESTLAHRTAYEDARGPIPDGRVIDHLCRNRACCNPDHLEAVTQGENVRRGLKGVLTTHCPRGHAYTPENTYTQPSQPKSRRCLACKRETMREWRRRNARRGG